MWLKDDVIRNMLDSIDFCCVAKPAETEVNDPMQRQYSLSWQQAVKAVICFHLLPNLRGKGLVHQTHMDNMHMLEHTAK